MAKLKNCFHVMIDLETLALDEKAVIISIGAVIYDDEWNEIDYYYANLDPDIQLEMGRESDDSTIEWWAKQDVKIKNLIYNNPDFPQRTDIDVVLKEMYSLIGLKTQGAKTFYWGNSAIFDLLKINSLVDDFICSNDNTKYKIDEYFMRCFKSIRDVFETYFNVKYDRGSVTHFAIDDCRAQGDFMKMCKTMGDTMEAFLDLGDKNNNRYLMKRWSDRSS